MYSLVLLILRLDHLKSKAQLESVLSRESTFLFNNMILVGIAATVLLLTTFPILSEAVTGRKVTMGPPIFNMVNIPWALILLALAGVGPLIAWRKATAGNLKRNFLVQSLVAAWVLGLLLVVDISAYGEAIRRIFERQPGQRLVDPFQVFVLSVSHRSLLAFALCFRVR